MKHIFTLTISQGLEDILAQELRKLQFQRITPESGAVRFYGSIKKDIVLAFGQEVLRECCSDCLVQMYDADDLYEGISQIPWHRTPFRQWNLMGGLFRNVQNDSAHSIWSTTSKRCGCRSVL